MENLNLDGKREPYIKGRAFQTFWWFIPLSPVGSSTYASSTTNFWNDHQTAVIERGN